MTIILFLIDTSASMNQRTYLGARPTLLDVAKDSVEKFLKIRQRDVASRGDRYMLLTFEEHPHNIKAGWKEHHNVFMNELKNLTANGMTHLGTAIKNCFDLLNLNRMQTGIDTYGQGRSPFFLEPSIIIAITDGGKLTNSVGVQEELNLPMHSNVPGSELTKEPFRWDQRLFALVLRLTGTPPVDFASNAPPGLVPCDISPIDAMCEVTGGRSYSVSSQRSLMQCLDSVVQKIQGGVVIQFEKFGPDPPPITPEDEDSEEMNGQDLDSQKILNTNSSLPNGFIPNHNRNLELNNIGLNSNSNNINGVSKPPWHTCRKLIYVQRSAQKGYSVGHWLIPESFWPDLNIPSLPPRTCHPVVKFTCTNSDPMVIDNLPFDKYELETSPLTQYILSRKQPQVSWQCFIYNSSNKSGDLGYPFGYLKASTNLSCVNLFVLPYNYPVLLPLLDELFKVHHCKPTREWKLQFEAYLKNMPLYYASPLKRALQRMGAPSNLVPESMENCLSYSVLNYLKRLKNQAKVDFDKMIASVGSCKLTIPETIKVINPMFSKKITDIVNMNNPTLKSRFNGLRNEVNDFLGFMIRVRDKSKDAKPQCYRNPYDINRNEIIDQIHRMRLNFLQPPGLIKYYDDDHVHSLPVSQMGNYQEYLKRLPTPLRELESAPVRQHMFGNPFKIDKKGMMIDEADIDLVGNNSPVRSPKRPALDQQPGSPRLKRRPGPLPKDFVIQRPYSSLSQTPPASPLPSPSSPSPSSSSFSLLAPSSPASQSSITSSNVSNQFTSSLLSSSLHLPVSSFVISSSPSSSSPLSSKNDQDSRQPADTSIVTTSISSSLNSNDLNFDPLVQNHINHINDVEVISEVPEMEVIAPLSQTHKLNSANDFNSSVSNSNEKINGDISTANCYYRNHSETFCNVSPKNYSCDDSLSLTQEQVEYKRNLFKLVRKPGKNYTLLIKELSKCNGSLRDYYVHEVIAEANRFKRKSLIETINVHFSSLDDNYLRKGVNNGSCNNFIARGEKPDR